MASRREGHLFTRFAKATSHAAGEPWAFIAAVTVVVAWACSGPVFGFGDTWQLVINTGTTIVTFLMVFLIQNTQNRDSTAMHVKIDELIRASKEADNALLNLEDLEEDELETLRADYERLASQARDALSKRREGGGREVRGKPT